MSDFEIRQILSGWLKIENWSLEELNETSMIRVVRMTLSSASEIMEVRKRERQIRQEEKLASQSTGDETQEKIWYPLTEYPSSANQTGEEKMEESRMSDGKMKGNVDIMDVKSEDEKSDQNLDDKQFAETESEINELPTKSVNKNANANDDKLFGKKGSADTNDSHMIEYPGIQPVPADQIPLSHGANPWTINGNVQVERNRAMPN